MTQRLFIGGYADGQWLDVKYDPPTYKVIELPRLRVNDLQVNALLPSFLETQTVTEHCYKLERVCFGSTDIVELFYVEHNLTPREAFRKLLEGYRRATQPR